MSNDKYLIGSEDKLELSMNITNDGKKDIKILRHTLHPKLNFFEVLMSCLFVGIF